MKITRKTNLNEIGTTHLMLVAAALVVDVIEYIDYHVSKLPSVATAIFDTTTAEGADIAT